MRKKTSIRQFKIELRSQAIDHCVLFTYEKKEKNSGTKSEGAKTEDVIAPQTVPPPTDVLGHQRSPRVARPRPPFHSRRSKTRGVARLTLSPRRLDTPSYTTQVSTLKFGWKNHSYSPPRNTTDRYFQNVGFAFQCIPPTPRIPTSLTQ
ncbi:unnamed protein product [Mesocestoides corti]|uniref:Uncharacterized protein n=1 Tax=Mesocestoides corti TaxID=53468 RepID=A0A0R3ULA2_MESCO|nr:unnamed protein product [Mesocestoides corti]